MSNDACFSDYAKVGGNFVFGEVAMKGAVTGDVAAGNEWKYSIWSFSILIPTVVFFSSFVSILFHLGVLQTLIMGERGSLYFITTI